MRRRISFVCPVFNLFILQCLSFMLDTTNPIVYLDQTDYLNVSASNKSSYFGHSVLLNPGSSTQAPWLQIGAPRANSPTVGFKNPGIIFRCQIGGLCNYIEIDTDEPEFRHDERTYHSDLSDAWIGAVMDINLRSNRSVVCAPRSSVKSVHRLYNFMLGACYWSDLRSQKFYKRIPLLNNDKFIYRENGEMSEFFDHYLGTSGLSVHISTYGKYLMIGAPGVWNWAGTSILYKDDNSYEEIPTKSVETPEEQKRREFMNTKVFSEAVVPDMKTISQVEHFDYFGYAVTTGYFFSKGHYCVSGAPRAKHFFGQIFVHTFSRHFYRAIDIKDSKEGTQFGEYFGSVLAAGDINNDGFDDLFVGAPFHKSHEFNEGRVYLFMGSSKNVLKVPSQGQYLDGNGTNGLFGTTITYLGKMKQVEDKDEPSYVAVSAPGQEGTGVVFIFRGTRDGINPIPFQTIRGKDIDPNVRGFGMSISNPADLDSNGYDDIAIGAHRSGHVIVLRSQGLLKLESYISNIPIIISAETTKFNITICYKFCCLKRINPIEITRRLSIDQYFDRASVDAGFREIENLMASAVKPTCENITIVPNVSPSLFHPLSIEVSTTFKERRDESNKLIISDRVKGRDSFCASCGAPEEDHPPQLIKTRIPFDLGCGYDDTPECDLHLDYHFKGARNNTLILENGNIVELEISVENYGHAANRLLVLVSVDEEETFHQIPEKCSANGGILTCAIKALLKKGEKEYLSLKLNVNNLNGETEKYISVNVILRTISNRESIIDEYIKLTVKRKAPH